MQMKAFSPLTFLIIITQLKDKAGITAKSKYRRQSRGSFPSLFFSALFRSVRSLTFFIFMEQENEEWKFYYD